MKDLSVVQKYMLCALGDRGTFPLMSSDDRALCLVAAGLLELEMEGSIAVDGKKVTAAGKLPAGRGYLAPLYDFIVEKQPVKLHAVVDAYGLSFSFSDKRLNELREAVGQSLVEAKAAEPCKAGLLGRQTGYQPVPEAVRSVVEEMRAELLEEGPVCDDTVALVVLLEQAKCLKQYFSEFERKAIRQKIKALVQSPEGKMVRDMMAYFELFWATRGAGAAGGAG